MTKEQIEAVIKSIVDGNVNDFEVLLNQYSRPIEIYLLRMLNFNQADCDDALAQTWLKVYQNLNSFNPQMQFSSWLYRIAHNEACNLIRTNAKFWTTDMELLNKPQLIDWDKTSNQAQIQSLETILSQLSMQDRNLLTLFYLDQIPAKEIAIILKTTPNNVNIKVKRAKDKAIKLCGNLSDKF